MERGNFSNDAEIKLKYERRNAAYKSGEMQLKQKC
jgi:hypothetical protein